MSIELFAIEGDVVKPTSHCYVNDPLKIIMELYPDNFTDRYAYLQYMTCMDEKKNPFLNAPENDKEELILASLRSDFSPEDDGMQEALEFCTILFDTPTKRAYLGAKKMYDKISTFLADTEITTGRDGNAAAINTYMKGQKEYAAAYKQAYRELQDEQGSTRVRGDRKKAYDQ